MKIITTVGTSLFTNYEKDRRISLGKGFEGKTYYGNVEKYKKQIEKNIQTLKKYIDEKQEQACAEITSLYKIKEKQQNDQQFEIILFASDTLKSYIASKVIEEYIKEKFKFTVKIIVIENLQVDSVSKFLKGIDNLIDEIFELIIAKGEPTKEKIIFNITGGYKGVIPYFSTIAQIFDYDIVYTFEDNVQDNELIEINPLPIEIDRGLLELYYPYLDNPTLITNEVKKRLVDLGLYKNDSITPLGKIALLTVKKTPLSKDVFGHFMEYKVYEYFVQKFFDRDFQCECLDFDYEKVGHGIPLGKGLSDIDIMLQKNNEIVWIEVKPITYLIDENNEGKLLEQIKNKQIGKWKESKFKDKQLKKYILIVYFYDERVLDQVQVEKFRQFFEEKNIEFDICYFKVDLAKSDKRKNSITSATYQTVMKDFEIKKLERIANV